MQRLLDFNDTLLFSFLKANYFKYLCELSCKRGVTCVQLMLTRVIQISK